MSKKTNKKLQKHHLDATSGGLIGGFNIMPKGWELRPKSENDPKVIEAAAKAGALAGGKALAKNPFDFNGAKSVAKSAAYKAGKEEAVKDTIWHKFGWV